jgi:hypothetical protein
VLAERLHGAALCGLSREIARCCSVRFKPRDCTVGCRGVLAVLWGSVVGLRVLCAVQGDTALIKAAAQGDKALLNQLIAVNANVRATNVIYCSCACVSHQSNSHIITLLKFVPPNEVLSQ